MPHSLLSRQHRLPERQHQRQNLKILLVNSAQQRHNFLFFQHSHPHKDKKQTKVEAEDPSATK